MKVAIAGPGGLGRYLLEEIPKEGHEVVALTRSHKTFLERLGIVQCITDYTVPNLQTHLSDCDAVVCTLQDESPDFTSVQLAILEACKRSERCKRFIPSVWAGNIQDVPDQPIATGNKLDPVLEATRSQNEVKYTIFCPGWFCDYLVPANQRYFKDLGDCWPQDYKNKVFTLYGRGTQSLDLTSARDAARAVGALLNHDSATWEPYTYVSGTQTTWYGLWEMIKSRDPEYNLRQKSLAQSIQQLMAKEDEQSVVVAMYEIMAHSEALYNPPERISRHKEKYFKHVEFRSIGGFMDQVAAHPGTVV
ncbi:hypothetical protein B0J12DRAFT_674373 [Macrophomina phaseolina]|uniref:NAD(P)-binding domain-containing protein n=1 Tax=Macrophomina phaseolina TaxID=35725 RepID=A0ABQ8G4S2_9PEZI|nr:hypothetical protein B0J12DRAFT_674373 [Macrophomina phaseolina]